MGSHEASSTLVERAVGETFSSHLASPTVDLDWTCACSAVFADIGEHDAHLCERLVARLMAEFSPSGIFVVADRDALMAALKDLVAGHGWDLTPTGSDPSDPAALLVRCTCGRVETDDGPMSTSRGEPQWHDRHRAAAVVDLVETRFR